MNKNNNRIIIISLVVVGLALFFWAVSPRETEPNNQQNNTTELLQKASGFDHAHGIAADRSNPDSLYIATHDGLYLLKTGSNNELFSVGSSRDDLMGFTAHPTDSTTFFSSGHPRTGGNIGFQKSTDSGKTWQKVSDGIDGPVDFHSMTVSQANPDIIFGSFHGKLQRSKDGGKTWEDLALPFVPIGFATTKESPNAVFAASPQGSFKSDDTGQTWKPMEDITKTGSVSAIAISGKSIVLYTEKMGMAFTDDTGQLVQAQVNLNGNTPLYADFSPTQQNIGYLITNTHSIYKTEDGGKSWSKIY